MKDNCLVSESHLVTTGGTGTGSISAATGDTASSAIGGGAAEPGVNWYILTDGLGFVGKKPPLEEPVLSLNIVLQLPLELLCRLRCVTSRDCRQLLTTSTVTTFNFIIIIFVYHCPAIQTNHLERSHPSF